MSNDLRPVDIHFPGLETVLEILGGIRYVGVILSGPLGKQWSELAR